MAKKTAKKVQAKPSTKKLKLGPTHYGSIAFGVGLLVVLISTFLNLEQETTKFVIAILALIGIAIGVLNITRAEANSFMIATVVIVLLLVQFIGLLSNYTGQHVEYFRFVTYLSSLMVPAALVVAFKTLFVVAKEE